MRTLEGERVDTPAETIFGISESSFNDLQSANHYVNDIIDSNPSDIDAVASDEKQDKFLVKRYTSPTGREAYRDEGDPDGVVKLRDTFWVGVYITHSSNRNGFLVRTAYPENEEHNR